MEDLMNGDKVNYNGENGVVKEIYDDVAFVVFHCNNDWKNYRSYTAQGCNISKLKKGWV